jgi:hypothetical protein
MQELLMKQTARIISIHAADTSGVCSMLYELGGMVVVHDASGCNSTYSTHDEPRWYRRDSMIYISALTEADAILGNDEKLIADVAAAAKDLSPNFIALCGAPVPLLAGTDFPAIATEIETRTGIPTFGLHTGGIHSYLIGASEALEAVVAHFCTEKLPRTATPSVNIIGATPLDFSVNGTVGSIIEWLDKAGFGLVSCMAMGSTLDDIRRASSAHVNLVVSSCGIATAELLRERFGTPWVAGVPVGERFPAALASALKSAVENGECALPCAQRDATAPGKKFAIPGEMIFSGSLARAIELDTGATCRVLCPLEAENRLLAPGDLRIWDEDAAAAAFAEASGVIADPMYAPVCPPDVPFFRLPHEAFSGRCYRKESLNLIDRPLPWRF